MNREFSTKLDFTGYQAPTSKVICGHLLST